MPVKKLKDFLDSNTVKYVTIKHSQAFTAQEIAAASHISGKEMAKTIMIKVDGAMAMAVLPASEHANLNLLGKAIGAEKVELASEHEFKDLFSECECGAMPPFGNLYGMAVYVSERLTGDEFIVFNSGFHTELIRMAYADFNRLVKPKVLKF